MGWTKRGVVRIPKLTAKQEEQIPIFAEKWNKIARSTEPFDMDATDEGMKRFLKAVGLRQPKRGFWWWESPEGAWKAAGFTYEEAQKKKTPDLWRYGQISSWSNRCFLTRAIDPAVVSSVETIMNRNIARSFPIRRVSELSNETTKERQHHIGYGQSDAPWLALADFFGTVLGNEHCQKLTGLMQAVASCGFVWVKPDKVLYCNRPEIAKFDDQGRPHCEDGPAIVYRDGWQFFYLNGIPTPETYIETPADDLKLDEVLRERNGAVRMAVIRKFGFARLLARESSVRVVSEAGANSLIEFKLKIGDHHNEYLRALRLKWQDKTGAKETVLPVPRLARQFGEDCPENVNDCEQVRRWTLGWPKEAMAIAET